MRQTLFHRLILLALIAVGLFALLYLGLFGWVCYAESHVETPPETDAIIVLGAQVKPDGQVRFQWADLSEQLRAYRKQERAWRFGTRLMNGKETA